MGPRAVRHDSELGSWEMVHGVPDPALREHVTRYLGFAERMAGPLRRREVPGGEVTVILNFGPELRVVDPGGGPPARLGSFVSGLDDEFADTEHDGSSHGIEVNLTPPAAAMVFGVPAHELARRELPLEGALGPGGPLLVERLAGARGWSERFRLLDAVLAARIDAAREPAPAAVWAWRRLRETEGRLPVRALGDEIGCSTRHLAAQFREHVGLPPKLFAQVLRFNRATRLLLRDDGRRWAEIAQDCGYFDQPHLNRDFARFAGTTPSAYLARRLPDAAGIAAG
jgi:AraC-like DNA-binding protein